MSYTVLGQGVAGVLVQVVLAPLHEGHRVRRPGLGWPDLPHGVAYLGRAIGDDEPRRCRCVQCAQEVSPLDLPGPVVGS